MPVDGIELGVLNTTNDYKRAKVATLISSIVAVVLMALFVLSFQFEMLQLEFLTKGLHYTYLGLSLIPIALAVYTGYKWRYLAKIIEQSSPSISKVSRPPATSSTDSVVIQPTVDSASAASRSSAADSGDLIVKIPRVDLTPALPATSLISSTDLATADSASVSAASKSPETGSGGLVAPILQNHLRRLQEAHELRLQAMNLLMDSLLQVPASDASRPSVAASGDSVVIPTADPASTSPATSSDSNDPVTPPGSLLDSGVPTSPATSSTDSVVIQPTVDSASAASRPSAADSGDSIVKIPRVDPTPALPAINSTSSTDSATADPASTSPATSSRDSITPRASPVSSSEAPRPSAASSDSSDPVPPPGSLLDSGVPTSPTTGPRDPVATTSTPDSASEASGPSLPATGARDPVVTTPRVGLAPALPATSSTGSIVVPTDSASISAASTSSVTDSRDPVVTTPRDANLLIDSNSSSSNTRVKDIRINREGLINSAIRGKGPPVAVTGNNQGKTPSNKKPYIKPSFSSVSSPSPPSRTTSSPANLTLERSSHAIEAAKKAMDEVRKSQAEKRSTAHSLSSGSSSSSGSGSEVLFVQQPPIQLSRYMPVQTPTSSTPTINTGPKPKTRDDYQKELLAAEQGLRSVLSVEQVQVRFGLSDFDAQQFYKQRRAEYIKKIGALKKILSSEEES